MELSDWPPGPVIPEDFLWHIFRQLVEAITVMHQGNGHLINGKEWKEIIHCDIHGTNIFVKPGEGGEGTALSLSMSDEQKSEERTFTKHKVSIAMSFFRYHAKDCSGRESFWRTSIMRFSTSSPATMITSIIHSITS
jgi:serine/threonine protein kinase